MDFDIKIFFALAYIFIQVQHSIGDEGHGCLVRGMCPGEYGYDVPCYNEGPPKPIEDAVIPNSNMTIIQTFKKYCPEIDIDSSPDVCCDAEILLSLFEKFEMLDTVSLSRCPSCYMNMRTFSCFMSCTPLQKKYGYVNEKYISDDGVGVMETTTYLSRKIASGLLDSCKDMQGFIPGTYLFDYGMCGKWGRKLCTPEKFFEFMGTPMIEGGYSLVKTNYILTPDIITVNGSVLDFMGLEAYRCSESPGPGHGPCSCTDCPDSCSKSSQSNLSLFKDKEEAEEFILFNKDGFTVTFAFLFLLLAAVSTVVFIWFKHRPVRKDTKSSYKKVFPTHQIIKNGDYIEVAQNGVIQYDFQKRDFVFESFMQWIFRKWAEFVCFHPLLVFSLPLLLSLLLSGGIFYNFKVTTNPVELWTSSSSQARQDMEYFNEHFEPFYRVEQVIITPTDKRRFHHKILVDNEYVNISWGPALRKKFLQAAFDLQRKIEAIEVRNFNTTIKLRDICLSPLKPLNNECAIQSIFGFFRNNATFLENEDDYLKQFHLCSNSRLLQTCFTSYGGPIDSTELIVGGYEESKFETAEVLFVTIPIPNYNKLEENENALLWERAFLDVLKNFSHPELEITYLAQRSIEDEIERQSHADVPLVALGYIVMLFYVGLMLGQVNSYKTFFVDSKLTLGIFGVSIIFLTMTTSLGLFCFLNIPATLIIIEVIPFLVLAVGVDNIFILVHAFQRDERKKNETLDEQITRVIGEIGPSIMLSTVSMSSCFFIASLTEMPAVMYFALYAGAAILMNLFLQMTSFLSLFIWDIKRQKLNRLDCFPWITAKRSQSEKKANKSGIIYSIFKKNYAPFLMKNNIRYIVIIIFTAWLCSSCAVIPKIDLGLDMELSVPKDSYVTGYIIQIKKYLSLGYPLYFVIKSGFNYSDPNAQKLVCASSTNCDEDSMLLQLKWMAEDRNKSLVAVAPIGWLDIYLDFLKSPSCCYSYKQNNSFCPSLVGTKHPELCLPCKYHKKYDLASKEFDRKAEYFINEIPWERCAKGGKAMYGSAVEIIHEEDGPQIGASHFMSYTTFLKSSKDHYESLERSREISETLTKKLATYDSTAEVFPYSFFHVYYEQYLTLWHDTAKNIGLSLLTIFIVATIFTGFDIRSSVIVVITVSMIVADLMGLMYWWDISLNALSLVNITVAVGLSVEFCCHLARTFALSTEKSRIHRAQDALCHTGTSILAGISFTDCGILFLAFAKSQILQVFYFRMYLGIIVIGTLHSLIFLPVLLSLFGPFSKVHRIQNLDISYKKCSANETHI